MNIGMEKKVDVDVFRQRIPDSVFKEFTLREEPYFFLYKFEEGYDFWLDGFYFAHPAILPPNGATAKLLELEIELIRDIRSRTLQNDKYPCRLVSTPGGGGTFPDISADHKLDFIKYNEPYVNAETIKAKFTWRVTPTDPINVWVMLFGYKIPENSLKMWE